MQRFIAMLLGMLLNLSSFAGGVTGWNPFHPVIAGVPLSCTSHQGQPVATILNPMLSDVGWTTHVLIDTVIV